MFLIVTSGAIGSDMGAFPNRSPSLALPPNAQSCSPTAARLLDQDYPLFVGLIVVHLIALVVLLLGPDSVLPPGVGGAAAL